LAQRIAEKLRQNEYVGESSHIVFREVLRALDGITRGNDPAPGEDYPRYERLRIGLRLCDLWTLLRENSDAKGLTLEEMSVMLDYYIDLGAVVPVVEVIDGVYVRTYRRGEADPIELAQLLHGILEEHSEAHPERPLTKTAFAKILSALAIYHGTCLPLVPVFEFRGMVPHIVDADRVEQQTEDALRFLARKQFVTYERVPRSSTPPERTLFE
jgi:hypothetical protein